VLLTWWVGAIPAIILGHLAVRDIKQNSDLRGMPLARMGLVFGYFFLFASLGFIFLADRVFFGIL